MTAVLTPDLDSRLETLAEQVQLLVDEAEERKRLKETYSDLVRDLSPIASQGMDTMTRAMSEAESKGYIEFAKNGIGVMDKVVTSFSEEDVAALGDNIVLILETVKEMTQPELMHLMRSTLHDVSDVEEAAVPPSMLNLLGQMREPEVRRGLARMIALLRSMGSTEINRKKEAWL